MPLSREVQIKQQQQKQLLRLRHPPPFLFPFNHSDPSERGRGPVVRGSPPPPRSYVNGENVAAILCASLLQRKPRAAAAGGEERSGAGCALASWDFYPRSPCAENPMLGSASWLKTANRPMRTTIPSQRKGSSRSQYLFLQVWQQEIEQEVETVESEERTER
ncbi:Hypothetical predicted protein [Podarcis lilfordi]|uniref:Uncharacterized protein n=2 Tax=Podarcis TaxID=42163 RepID=A0AA35PB21_9SAUR|nr:Hypothetical predicted protein [Podarcis lilfordi]